MGLTCGLRLVNFKITMEKRARIYIIAGFVLLAVMLVSVMAEMAVRRARLIEAQAHEEAGSLFDTIVLVRHWNSEYGGVYVKKKPGAEQQSQDAAPAESNDLVTAEQAAPPE